MHNYSTDAQDRNSIPLWLAVFAVAATLLLNGVFVALKLKIPWWIDAPSVMGFYSIFLNFFEKFLWSYRIWFIRFSDIPDVQGTWLGVINSSYNDGIEVPEVILRIQQNWLKISIQMETRTSRSFSTMAAVNTAALPESGLKYEYANEPSPFTKATMQPHRGLVRLRLSEDESMLSGDYFTNRNRLTYGEMNFKRITRKSITREQAIALSNP